ncbi:peptidoglycan DD-metalloendopeptidase family protein [Streptomyces sp. UNOC14_S4]|uniref:M23 family metallopeptidase n=1 Tax=Streptomyces sp. UNOC14_S4 TaxID=2872340 RepID=UPI001E2C594F|nr:peptidoglycan DD-metalloendopeptidase family protein [Streptomyces sp. UNOC14_S4]MCC3770223.1 peptidoglycan DD-metalloendopeptidase family protein [Streptomyces sp. UNOC14_S4]
MNDRHPSAGSSPTGPAQDLSYGHYTSYEQQGIPHGYPGYEGHASGQWDTSGWGHPDASWGANTAGWGQQLPADNTDNWAMGTAGQTQTWEFSGYDTGHTGQWDTSGWGQGTGQATDTHSWNTSGSYDTSAATGWQHPADSGWSSGPSVHAQSWDTGQHPAGDTSGWGHPVDASWGDTGSAPQTQIWDAGAYADLEDPQRTPTLMVDLSAVEAEAAPTPAPTAGARSVADAETRTMLVVEPPEPEAGQGAAGPAEPTAHPDVPAQARSRRKGAPSRSGYRPRRKALLTVAVPSVAVMGVAGIAAASVSGGKDDGKHTQAASAPDNPAVSALANSKLDTQLAGLSRGADDFATRASRNQERIDLKLRQEEEKKRKAEEEARKEAERPKFALPVDQHGLSALFGQAGANWMSVHTGIDFPVSYGTPVMAATDGTVRTQYNVAYGNMAIVTAPDGTETWYCHLSSTKFRSGKVKAGDVIAYSGDSGNSTGPHLHFEVRPGGSAVDPLPWLRAHDLDPT